MHTLAILGCTITGGLMGAFVGGLLGFTVGSKDDGDFIGAGAMFAIPVGAVVGGLIGVTFGSLVFA